jgi:hypothetical protein
VAVSNRVSHRAQRQGPGRRGYLYGFKRSRTLLTVTGVDPPSIAGGASGFVDVTVPGAVVSRSRRVLMFPPATLEAGLQVVSTLITAANTVRITLKNTTGAPIDGASRTWTARLFRQ